MLYWDNAIFVFNCSLFGLNKLTHFGLAKGIKKESLRMVGYRQTKVLMCNIFISILYLITGTRVLLGARISRL